MSTHRDKITTLHPTEHPTESERGLKIVFWVEDLATKGIIVEKSQTIIPLSDKPFGEGGGLTIKELARDHVAELRATLEELKDKPGTEWTDDVKNRVGEPTKAGTVVDEYFLAAGDNIGRFIRLKLRDWARKKIT
jgi:hypothetical protein